MPTEAGIPATLRVLLLLITLLTGCTITPQIDKPLPPINATAPAVAQTSTGMLVVMGTPFQLKINQTVSLDAKTTLVFKAVQDDTRCPTDVSCFEEGSVRGIVEVIVDGKSHDTLSLTLFGKNRSTPASTARILDYMVHFVALDPYPKNTSPIPEADYSATFMVEPIAATATPH